ncbi:phage head-tail connector protein [Limnoglobus roseus]|uniref:Uncharacterized protein n=1 Tax=Limnoglobus roseus TaxID=2598579 RepID=A0A5C1ACG1_9BACT|nr:phage head-tail connector protein [Limnoglobus roseus]QEL14728.1 hypothetical protein PX52LOC_01622 [Limnoglobus roseus]
MPIDTRSNVKMMLGITTDDDDDFLDRLMGAADAFIVSHCGRSFTGGAFTEYHPAGGRVLFLANFPISTVTGVKVDPSGAFGAETLLGADAYALLADRGVLTARGGAFGGSGDGPVAVQVVYETATDAVPLPVSRAYAELVGIWYRQAKTAAHLGQLNLISQEEGGMETTYASGANGFRVPATVLQLLELYRVPPM